MDNFITIDSVLERVDRAQLVGENYRAVCPAHHSRNGTRSLAVKSAEGRVLIYCHAGCSYGDVLAALGLDHTRTEYRAPVRQARTKSNVGWFRKLWSQAHPLWTPLAEPARRYLDRRGLSIDWWPTTLRFHEGLKHPDADSPIPAVLASVTDVHGALTGLHRTFIDLNGYKADVTPVRMTLGTVGGHAVHLATPKDGVMAVAEGIESALAYSQLHDNIPAWACLSAVGMRGLRLPDGLERLVIAADNDTAGLDAAAALQSRCGIDACIEVPERGDWNDTLVESLA